MLKSHPAALRHRFALPFAVLGNAVAIAALAVLHLPALAWLSMGVAGAGMLVVDVAVVTELQVIVPSHLLGRVDALLTSAAVAGVIAGNALAAAAIDVVGLQPALVVCAAPAAALALVALRPVTARGADRLSDNAVVAVL